MKKIYPFLFLTLSLFGCDNVQPINEEITEDKNIPSNEPYYCSAPTKEAKYEYAQLNGTLRRNYKAVKGYTFVSFNRTYHVSSGIIDKNTTIYDNKVQVKKFDSSKDENQNVTAYFSIKTKSEEAKWIRLVNAPTAENITYLIIGEIPDELNNIQCYIGNYSDIYGA